MFGKSKRSKAPIPAKILAENNGEVVFYNIEEIRSMRDEINWRVKVAYNSSVAFISVFSFVVVQLFSTENTFIDSFESDPDLFIKAGLGIIILIAAWVGVQNANHLIEKRIELYTLDLMKNVYKESSHVFFSWLGFLYGSVFFRRKSKNFIAKFLNASIGLFTYFLPNIIAFGIWLYFLIMIPLKGYLPFFYLASFFVMIAMSTSFFLFFYVVKVNNNHTKFYKEVMQPYFERE
ncbi:hypothetical protein [Ekhidna sp.]|uniref:hypothetical protein n=1 Tax=Ekhidna sp. TaxID=2608089 RepID=UPI003CCBC9E7